MTEHQQTEWDTLQLGWRVAYGLRSENGKPNVRYLVSALMRRFHGGRRW